MADPITDILEEIADAISSISDEAADLLENMSGLVEELEDMVVIDRMDARTEDEMWDEEVRRLKALHEKEAELVAALTAIGGIDDPEQLENYMFDLAQDEATRKRANIAYQLLIIRETIREILFQDPGVIPETLYSLREILERFRTLEQPRIETIMDATEDTIEETTEILAEVKKLFVKKRWVMKNPLQLTVQEKAVLDELNARKNVYSSLISKHVMITETVSRKMLDFRPGVLIAEKPGLMASRIIRKIPVSAAGGRRIKTRAVVAGTIKTPTGSWSSVALRGAPSHYIRPPDLAMINGYAYLQGNVRLFERELLKIDRKITRLSFELVEEPGVIPRTLDDVHLSLARFRTVEQPKIEKIMDITEETIAESKTVLVSVDAAVNELKNLVIQLNTSLTKVQGWLDFLAAYRLPLLAGCAVFGLLVIAIMIAVLLVLIKIALA